MRDLHVVNQPFSHCSYCGADFPPGAGWPRVCPSCGGITYRNPIPVSVVLAPVMVGARRGVLTVRRAIPPKVGELALPGGYVNFGETWQQAGAREVFEETCAIIDPAEIREFRVRSAPDGTLIIFALAPPRPLESLPPFIPNDESLERVVLLEPAPMAFGLHSEIVEQFFQEFVF